MCDSSVQVRATGGPVSERFQACVCVLFNVFQQRGAGVHHGLEGVFAAGGDTFVRVQQDRQLPVRLVHLLPENKPAGTKIRIIRLNIYLMFFFFMF